MNKTKLGVSTNLMAAFVLEIHHFAKRRFYEVVLLFYHKIFNLIKLFSDFMKITVFLYVHPF